MKQLNVIMLTALFCLIIGSILMLNANSQETPVREQDRFEFEATPIQAGAMTEKQEKHSKLYGRYNTGKKIQDLLNLDNGPVVIRRSLPFRFGSPDQLHSEVELKRISCAADAILVGRIKSSASQITASQSFLFTDYSLLVQEVLKNNSPSVIDRESEVSITRPGGAVLINDKRITAIDESFLPLRKENRYLLFLRYLPDTQSFESIETGETYEVTSSDLRLLKGGSREVVTAKTDLITFVNEIKAVNRSCN
jgi:hypothetical protein